ncbi:MAG: tyrosine-type recombinase/integrase [Desulfobacterales bacterium]
MAKKNKKVAKKNEKLVRKNKKYPGVYSVKGKKGVSYGIDYIHPQTGQRVKKVIKKCDSEAKAFEIRSIEITDAARGAIDKAYGIKDKGPVILFDVMIDEYLKYWSLENKDYRTDKQRATALKEAFKGKLMSDINPFMIEQFKRNMVKEKQKQKNTVNKYLCLGSQVFKKAIEWNKYNGINPFLEASRFKIKKKIKPGSLTPEQVASIMDEIKHSVKRDMVEFAYNTGWRISEIIKLKWDEINLQSGTAWILDPKNKNSVEIELNDRVLEIISSQKRRCEYVFCHKNGKRFKTGLRDTLKNAATRAGVQLPTRKAWHILRRTWASMFLQNGGDIETLRVLGNWKDYSMPMWYADSANSEHKRKILNQIPKINGRNQEEIGKVVNIRG